MNSQFEALKIKVEPTADQTVRDAMAEAVSRVPPSIRMFTVLSSFYFRVFKQQMTIPQGGLGVMNDDRLQIDEDQRVQRVRLVAATPGRADGLSMGSGFFL